MFKFNKALFVAGLLVVAHVSANQEAPKLSFAQNIVNVLTTSKNAVVAKAQSAKEVVFVSGLAVAAFAQEKTSAAKTWFNALSKNKKAAVVAGGVAAASLVAYGIYKLVKKDKKANNTNAKKNA